MHVLSLVILDKLHFLVDFINRNNISAVLVGYRLEQSVSVCSMLSLDFDLV